MRLIFDILQQLDEKNEIRLVQKKICLKEIITIQP